MNSSERDKHSAAHTRELAKWQMPTLDMRIVTAMLCCFIAGVLSAVKPDFHIQPVGNGNILHSVFISLLKYIVFLSMCWLSLKIKPFTVVLFIYDAVCAVIMGFYSAAFFTPNTAIIAAFILPMLIYCYVLAALTSELLTPHENVLHFHENGAIISTKERFLRSLISRSRIIAFAIIIEGIIAPFVK